MPNFPPVEEQLAYIKKGAAEIIRARSARTLEKSLKTGKPLRVKAGFDPTAPDLHLGHTVLIRKLKHFQDLGHTVIFLIGDFTGLIGDPTGRYVTRPPLTREEIERNAETYKEQVFKILDPRKDRGAISTRDWFSTMLGSRTSFGWRRSSPSRRCWSAKTFTSASRKRSRSQCTNCSIPLAQGYDSVALEADVELGGTDQKFNLLMGRELQTPLRAAIADRAHHADPGRHRRRAEDVEVVRQLHRHQRTAAGDVTAR